MVTLDRVRKYCLISKLADRIRRDNSVTESREVTLVEPPFTYAGKLSVASSADRFLTE